MMPVSFVIALLIAFGFEPEAAGVPQADVVTRVLEMFGGVMLMASLAFGLGFWVAFRASHIGSTTSKLRQGYAIGARLITFLSLLVYGWIIHSVGWSNLVRANWGLDRVIFFDDLVVFLPFVMIQLVVWWGLFFADRALQLRLGIGVDRGLIRYLVLKGRQSLGLTLPVILWYVLRRDVVRPLAPSWETQEAGELIEMAVIGLVVLALSPLFVRVAWPTYSLPAGPLRRRLERAAERVGFRYTDILVWDTGQMMVNACVTGILPRFRYVLLSDALLEQLTPMESTAVFGHEIGHVVHRHFLYFAFFFIGSIGLLSVFGDLISLAAPSLAQSTWLGGAVLAAALGVYFWFIFGHLSRRFERQADVFGGKVVSCETADCPPHTDLDSGLAPAVTRKPILCPVGIRIFADALANVAQFNGLDRRNRSWRHGSIASRIAFVESLERHPEREQRFQRGVRNLRLGLGVFLFAALVISAASEFWGLFR